MLHLGEWWVMHLGDLNVIHYSYYPDEIMNKLQVEVHLP